MNQYKLLEPEEQEELLSNFLISAWSYSKVSTYARHQKSFEMQYIFGLYSKSGPSAVAGKAYHKALQMYFAQIMAEGTIHPIHELEAAAFQYLEELPGNAWKLGKKTPTVEEAAQETLGVINKLILFFYSERSVYEEEMDKILAVELYFSEWITVNGVDIPMPCNGMIDLVLQLVNGKVVVVDHKSKSSYMDDEEASLGIGIQAITYALAYEAKTGIKVDEVWFVENKYSKNKDGGAQLRPIKVELNANTRKLYEALLYEPLREMIAAVKDPDHVYLINQADNYVDMAEVYDFWCRTQICEVEEFNVDPEKKAMVAKRLKKIRDSNATIVPPSVIKAFKEKAATFIQYDLSFSNMTHEQKIEHVLRTFNVLAEIKYKFEGYSSDSFLLAVSAGVKVASIFKYRLDIANALDVSNVRISQEMVVHEGKSYLAVDISKKRTRDLVLNPSDLVGFKIPIGKDNFGNTIVWDLANHSTPHVLVCGATGSGKSVCVCSTVHYAKQAGVKDIIVLDPKYEFGDLAGPGIDVISDIADIEAAMSIMVEEMEARVKSGKPSMTLIVFDEFADAFANSRSGSGLKKYEEVTKITSRSIRSERVHTGTDKSLEENLRLILQKGRSSGFRVMAATQRASVKVITGDAKVNFPVQICFRVPKEADSRVVLDEPGAESLAGAGDGLIKSPEYHQTVRFQAYFSEKNSFAVSTIAK